jgi:hypothetical protein
VQRRQDKKAMVAGFVLVYESVSAKGTQYLELTMGARYARAMAWLLTPPHLEGAAPTTIAKAKRQDSGS